MKVFLLYFYLFVPLVVLFSCEKGDVPEKTDFNNVGKLKTIWTSQLPTSFESGWGTVLLKDGGFLLPDNMKLIRFDSNGKEKWSLLNFSASEIVELPNGRIITKASDFWRHSSVLHCISETGSIVWKVTDPDNAINHLTLGRDNNVYGLSYKENSYFFSERGGVVKVFLINSETGELSIISEFSHSDDGENHIRFGEGKLYVPNRQQAVLVTNLFYDGDSSKRQTFDICLFIMDIERNQFVTKKVGGFKSEVVDDLAMAPDGSLYILGITDSKDGDVKSYYNYEEYSDGRPWVIKLDSHFNIVWEKVLLLKGSNIRGESIASGDNSVYLTITGEDRIPFYGIVRLDELGNYSDVALAHYELREDEDMHMPHSFINSSGEAYFYFTRTTDKYYNTKVYSVSKKAIGNL